MFIHGGAGQGKTHFLTNLSNALQRGGLSVDFLSITSDFFPFILEYGIDRDIYPTDPINVNYFLNLKKQKIKFGKLDILIIDDIHFLGLFGTKDDWTEILELDCIKIISIDGSFKKNLNGLNYKLFDLSQIEIEVFSTPLIRDKKIRKILND